MKRITFLTPDDAWPGFVLAGMEHLIATPESVELLLREQVEDRNTGLVILDERLSEHLKSDSLAQIDRHHPGKVTILPSPEGGESQFALEIIRQAIGYHVRFK
jgi:vacuolar-type H+-ATPase subunit F/Vma7